MIFCQKITSVFSLHIFAIAVCGSESFTAMSEWHDFKQGVTFSRNKAFGASRLPKITETVKKNIGLELSSKEAANEEIHAMESLEIGSSDFDFSFVQRSTLAAPVVSNPTKTAIKKKAKIGCDVDLWQSGKGAAALPISLSGSCFEEYWLDLPSLHRFVGNKVIISFDGFSFTERMSVFKFMMFELDKSSLWGQNATLREYHWLWAYAAQLDWQKRSGRLSEQLTKTAKREPSAQLLSSAAAESDRISLDSWWGYMNFCFSVAILKAFENTGLLSRAFGGREVIVQMDKLSQALVDHDQFVGKCVHAWERLLRTGYADYVKQVAAAGSSGAVPSDDDLQNMRFQLQKEVWTAHTAVIVNGEESETYQELLAKMPSAEQGFGSGWAKAVEMLAACSFPTDLMTLQQYGAGFLPIQILTDSVWLDLQRNGNKLSAVDKKRFNTVKSTHSLLAMSAWSMNKLIAFWARVVQTAIISRCMPVVINDLYHGSWWAKARQSARLILLFARPI